jgi:PD-(D/E)XK nuclease superfamily
MSGKNVILEIKSIEQILPSHEAQLLAYLRLSSCAVGLLLNPNTNPLNDGIRRFVNTSSCSVFRAVRETSVWTAHSIRMCGRNASVPKR